MASYCDGEWEGRQVKACGRTIFQQEPRLTKAMLWLGAGLILSVTSSCSSLNGGSPTKVEKKIEEQKLGPLHDSMVGWLFSKDGLHLAYATNQGAKWFAVADGQVGPEYDGIEGGTPVFSPDGNRVAYVAAKGDKRVVVVDGQAGPRYDAIRKGHPVFSPGGKRFAYAAQKGNKQVVVIDGQVGPEYGGIAEGHPVFSPDGNRVAYVAANGFKRFVVIDGQAGPECDGIGE
ncbi:MAG: hypothetical protein QUV05_20885, partial [Phycisphaerae bacterium]|nr:hypothetical protein [Phycisphaerae bacterium]